MSQNKERKEVNTQDPSRFQPPVIGLDFSSPAVTAALRDETGFLNNEKIKRNGKLILVFILISVLLVSSILSICLFIHYSTICTELTVLRLNVSNFQKAADNAHNVLKTDLTANRDILVSNFQKTADNAHNVLKTDLTANRDILEKLCKVCPRGWRASGNNCYYFSSTSMTWDGARSECNKFSSELVTLSSQSKMETVNRLIHDSTRYWIGLRRDTTNVAIWRWMDETEVTFTNWAVNEPNFTGQWEHCGETDSGFWNDCNCYDNLNYICEKVPVC